MYAGGAAALAGGLYGGYKIAKRIKRARARQVVRKQIGMQRFTTPAKNIVQIDQNFTTINEKTWSAVDLCAIAQSTAVGLNNVRDHRWVHISGFKHKANWINTSNIHIIVYQYWLVPKQYTPGITDADLQSEFFTQPGQAADVDENWRTDSGQMDYDQQINSEKFMVLKKVKFTLGPANQLVSDVQKSELNSTKSENMYISLNRKFTYEQVVGEANVTRTEQPPVFYINFCVRMGTNPTPTQSPVVSRELRVVTYFRDGPSA